MVFLPIVLFDDNDKQEEVRLGRPLHWYHP